VSCHVGKLDSTSRASEFLDKRLDISMSILFESIIIILNKLLQDKGTIDCLVASTRQKLGKSVEGLSSPYLGKENYRWTLKSTAQLASMNGSDYNR
jgi:hypothetical protein